MRFLYITGLLSKPFVSLCPQPTDTTEPSDGLKTSKKRRHYYAFLLHFWSTLKTVYFLTPFYSERALFNWVPGNVLREFEMSVNITHAYAENDYADGIAKVSSGGGTSPPF